MRTARTGLTILALILATGCDAGRSSARTGPLPVLAASRETDLPTSAPPTTAADPSCQLHDLAVAFHGGGLGAGNIIGSVSLRNVGPDPCLLDDPVTLLPLSSAGMPVLTTTWLTSEPAKPPLLLTPRTPAPPPGLATALGQVIAVVIIAGEYRDGPGPNGLCPPQEEVKPTFWRVSLRTERVRIRNADPAASNGPGSIEACLGAFHTELQSAS